MTLLFGPKAITITLRELIDTGGYYLRKYGSFYVLTEQVIEAYHAWQNYILKMKTAKGGLKGGWSSTLARIFDIDYRIKSIRYILQLITLQ